MTTAHKTRNPLFIVFTCGILCISCLREGAVGEGATYQLEVSETSISVPADSPDQPVLEKTLSITSNRSWSAFCDPAVDWLTLSVDELENIARIRDQFQIAILLIEHDMNLVMGVCEGICVLNFGRVIAKGTADEIQANPVVIEAYLGKKKEG